MKNNYFIGLVLFLLLGTAGISQPSNGSIYADSNNLYIIKVQGSHYERGFAQGELLGSRITDIFQNYVFPQFGSTATYNQVKAIVATGNLFSIDSLFIVEAKALIAGMNSVNSNTQNLDYADILLANSILDIKSIMQAKAGLECSSLMSWGSATSADATLSGKSVISRHLDWTIKPVLVRNQVMVIHVPSETNEQAWAQIGFAGMISVLSGFNANIGVFQHMMSDDNSHGVISGNYEPIWFTLRKSIEQIDPNQDGKNNVNDVKHFIDMQPQGFADGYIISALARSTEIHDSLIALVAEIAADAPFITYRSNSFSDTIPDDNLYTANNQIARNSSLNYCSRYYGVASNIGNGTSMSLVTNRTLMASHSHLSSNYQFMTFAPEVDLFRISIRETTAAYLEPYMDLSISGMLQENMNINPPKTLYPSLSIFPNPTNQIISFDVEWKQFEYQIYDVNGRGIMKGKSSSNSLNISALSEGVYYLVLRNKNEMLRAPFVVN
ncbi:MAG: T9SS type A sorting domain-containing protein [Bacteroidales bacterium]|nr:T9SS type A sorting domain-containing protein [Bacteroidales bacterium]